MLKETLTNLIGSTIVTVGRAIKVYNLEMYSKHGFEITPEQYLVLSAIRDDENFNQNKLCELLHKDKSNMTRLISILESKNLIEKITQTDNKKQANIIKITEKGRQVRGKIAPIMLETRKHYLQNISQDDMYTCIKVLSQIQENLENGN